MVFDIVIYFIGVGLVVTIFVISTIKFVKKNNYVKNIDEISNKIKSVLNVSENSNKNKENTKLKKCSYCGGSYEGSKCPHCGASEIK